MPRGELLQKGIERSKERGIGQVGVLSDICKKRQRCGIGGAEFFEKVGRSRAMRRVRVWIGLGVGLLVVGLFVLKPSKGGGKHDAFFSGLNRVLKGQAEGQPALVIDLGRLDHNTEAIRRVVREPYRLRIVVKSLPSLELLSYLCKKTDAKGLMVFHARFLPRLFGHFGGQMDYLLGKPWSVEAAQFAVRSMGSAQKQPLLGAVQWLVDSRQRLERYLAWAKAEGLVLRINLEIDVGLRRGGFADAKALKEALNVIASHPKHLVFSGLMGYDGHVPHTPFAVPSQRSAVQRAFQEVLRRYEAFVSEARSAYPSMFAKPLTLNGGGSKTYSLYQGMEKRTSIRDLSIGSAFLQPAHFDFYTLAAHRPAVWIAAPVLKKLEGNQVAFLESFEGLLRWWDPNRGRSFYIYGGGWSREIASPTGLVVEPLTAGAPNANLLPNQSLLIGSDAVEIEQGDFVFFRPMEGDALLNFETIDAVRGGQVIARWKSFPVRF